MANNRYCVDYAKRGTASCKECKEKIDKGCCRIGKVVPNPFTDGEGDMKQWYHVACMFKQLSRARATTKKIEKPADLEGWEDLEENDKDEILKHMQPSKSPPSPRKKQKFDDTVNAFSLKKENPKIVGNKTKGDSFKDFRRLCANIAEESSYLKKSQAVSDFLKADPNRDLYLWVKMLLPAVSKRIYNLQSKQLVKLFSQIFGTNQESMLEDLENGDVAETIRIFFEESASCQPIKKSNLTLKEVDKYLEELSNVTKEEEQTKILQKITQRCTGNDLKMIIRLITHDLRFNAGPKHILDGIHPSAYEAFQTSHDLKSIIQRINEEGKNGESSLSKQLAVLTPVLPMLAEPCRSVENAFKKCPNGMYAEIKYDGERVQVHKKGNTFTYFSRSLKPVQQHKISHFKDHIAKAFQQGKDLILDSEILLLDTKTDKPLPFGTLGVHKKTAFKDATVCLFVFDCIYYNGKDLMDCPLKERRKILQENMEEVKDHIKFSEMKFIKTRKELNDMMTSIFKQGLEGLVLKDPLSTYKPGKRHWLKVKKDYLHEGSMADSADLVVLGAYFGTGSKGGMMSIFLMGCFDKTSQKWCTVTKVHGGHTDAVLEKLQTELDMVKVNNDTDIPHWLNVKKSLIPDFVCKDPKTSQVWEIAGAEFSKAEAHTAGISIRFPRVTLIRYDKTWKEATTLEELEVLYEKSKQTADFEILDNDKDNSVLMNKENTPKKGIKRHCLEDSNSPKKVLVDIFTNVKLYIPEDVDNFETLKRYFIAYGGILLQNHEIKKSTHFLDIVNSNPPKNAIIIVIDWLWDSIKLQERLPVEQYKPNF
ncbi:DNA ligase 3-like [Centruroides sculpturatus]|uniref:DNA ligase 3-like n=1 Tax=Centruroides sculpturatus TaxID=218467 RepID=UPI000C6EA269|nr:DNA ligase 3-like [Centruroides sculpturatus]